MWESEIKIEDSEINNILLREIDIFNTDSLSEYNRENTNVLFTDCKWSGYYARHYLPKTNITYSLNTNVMVLDISTVGKRETVADFKNTFGGFLSHMTIREVVNVMDEGRTISLQINSPTDKFQVYKFRYWVEKQIKSFQHILRTDVEYYTIAATISMKYNIIGDILETEYGLKNIGRHYITKTLHNQCTCEQITGNIELC